MLTGHNQEIRQCLLHRIIAYNLIEPYLYVSHERHFKDCLPNNLALVDICFVNQRIFDRYPVMVPFCMIVILSFFLPFGYYPVNYRVRLLAGENNNISYFNSSMAC